MLYQISDINTSPFGNNKYNKCKVLQTSNQKFVRKLLTYLYSNSSFSMKRKREKAEAFLAGKGGM